MTDTVSPAFKSLKTWSLGCGAWLHEPDGGLQTVLHAGAPHMTLYKVSNSGLNTPDSVKKCHIPFYIAFKNV